MQWFRDRRSRGRPPHPDVLTPAEWRVLEHVRAGRSNPEIAAALGLSLNTVKTHVSSMLVKLDARDRAELAAWRGEPALVSRAALRRPYGGWLAGWLSKGAAALGTVAVGALVVLALSSASRGGDAGATATPTSPAAAATATEEPGASATPTPVVLVDGLPAGAVGPLLVYGEEVRTEQGPGRIYPVIRLVVHDHGTGHVVSEFEVGGLGGLPTDVLLAGREVLVNDIQEIVAYDLAGGRRSVYQAPAGSWLGGLQVSPDGKTIAVAEGTSMDRADSNVLFLSVADGRELRRISGSSDALAALEGIPEPRMWRSNGRRVLLVGNTSSGRGLIGAAYVSLDGSIEPLLGEGDALGVLDPSGRYMMLRESPRLDLGPAEGECAAHAGLRVVALEEGGVVARRDWDTALVVNWEWSPKGDQLLVGLRDAPDTGDECVGVRVSRSGPTDFVLVDMESGALTADVDRDAVRERWSAESGVPHLRIECVGPHEVTLWDGSGRTYPRCTLWANGEQRPAEWTVDGQVIATGLQDRILGWIAVP